MTTSTSTRPVRPVTSWFERENASRQPRRSITISGTISDQRAIAIRPGTISSTMPEDDAEPVDERRAEQRAEPLARPVVQLARRRRRAVRVEVVDRPDERALHEQPADEAEQQRRRA